MDSNALYKQTNVAAGQDCEISPFCSLENVVLGDRVRIAAEVQLKNVVVGSNCKISRRVTFYSPDPQRPVRIGHHCCFMFGVFGEATGGEMRIGNHTGIAHNTVLLTSSGPGPNCPILESLQPAELGSIIIGNHCWIGAQSLLLPNVELGEGCTIGGNSLVGHGRYKPWSVYFGSPVRLLQIHDAAAVAAAKAKCGLNT